MCGIIGTINFDINRNRMKDALEKTNHRGPDSYGIFIDNDEKYNL